MTNHTEQLARLIAYMRHIFESYNSGPDLPDDPFHSFTPDEWVTHTATQMSTYLIQNLPSPLGPNPVPSGPISSSRPTGYSTAALELIDFRKAIKSKIAAYPAIKDERYSNSFSRSLFIVAKSHECNEVLEPTYNPSSEP